MNKYKSIIYIGLLLFAVDVVSEEQDLAKFFENQAIDGTIVISSLKTGQTFIHNDRRASIRFSTASTFKILNSLIALEERVISARNDIFKWNGHIYAYSGWNSDQTLESAFKLSCVWCYQVLARQIGIDKYKNYLQKLKYGVLSGPVNETTFWLDGSLKISAIEQVSFLKKIYQRTLPFSKRSYEVLKEIMLVEQTPTYSIWAKTGWAARVKPQVGWYVGYVKTRKDVWFFATQIEIKNKEDLTLRQKLTMDALKAKAILKLVK